VPISKAVGANRIYTGVAIPYPTGYPDLSHEEEEKNRYKLIQKAVEALTIMVDEQTVF